MPSKRWTSGSGYDGLFGDSFFSDCYRIVDGSSGQSSRRKHIIHEDVTTDISEDRVKPWFRKTNLSRISDDDIYQVMLEVTNFTPSELSVKLANDKTVIVEGKHGERPDMDGFVSREFTRKYNLPESVDPSSVECYLSKDGVLVIRGHAPRSNRLYSSHGKLFGEQIQDHDSLVPIFTQGYHTRHNNASSSTSIHHLNERIIPISRENGAPKATNNNTFTATKTELDGDHELSSGRSSRSDKGRATLSPQPNEFADNNGTSGRRSRTVSFNEDDTIASNSPIIEEPASTLSDGFTPEPQSKKIPTLSRQNNVQESFSEFRSSSRMSEERSSTPTSKNGKNNTETAILGLDDKRGEFFRDHNHDFLRTRSPLDNFDKLHKEIIDRHRHISRESLERMQMESDKVLRNVSPIFQYNRDDDDFMLDSALKKFDRNPSKWHTSIPPKSKEEQYEKKFEKGYDKDGNYTQTLEEKMFSHQYSSTSELGRKYQPRSLFDDDKHHKSLEHHFNISSAA
ncbi:heat shock protein 67B1 [Folsomia candida]|nr:heat shock protein 67B1 [Folsomia candida]